MKTSEREGGKEVFKLFNRVIKKIRARAKEQLDSGLKWLTECPTQ